MTAGKWISVRLKSGRIENHPDVVSLDCEDDLTLWLASGSYVRYTANVWDQWSVTTVDEILAANRLKEVQVK